MCRGRWRPSLLTISVWSPCSPKLLFLCSMYHALSWPQLSYVAEDSKGRIVGYVLAKMWVVIELDRIRRVSEPTMPSTSQGGRRRRSPTRPHHFSFRHAHISTTRTRGKTDAGVSARHGTRFRRALLLPPCQKVKPSCAFALPRYAQIRGR